MRPYSEYQAAIQALDLGQEALIEATTDAQADAIEAYASSNAELKQLKANIHHQRDKRYNLTGVYVTFVNIFGGLKETRTPRKSKFTTALDNLPVGEKLVLDDEPTDVQRTTIYSRGKRLGRKYSIANRTITRTE